jgi:hypothetical protein
VALVEQVVVAQEQDHLLEQVELELQQLQILVVVVEEQALELQLDLLVALVVLESLYFPTLALKEVLEVL